MRRLLGFQRIGDGRLFAQVIRGLALVWVTATNFTRAVDSHRPQAPAGSCYRRSAPQHTYGHNDDDKQKNQKRDKKLDHLITYSVAKPRLLCRIVVADQTLRLDASS